MKPLRFLRRGSPGQSMVLGAVAMLALTLGVLATLNLGQAVHEKIKLQNTADAAAYSLATMEARTFNFIAFTNRLQITHYHTAMVMQSYLSHAGFALAYFGSFLDVLRAFAYGLDTGCRLCPYPPLRAVYCSLSGVFGGVSRGLDQIGTIAQYLLYDMPIVNGHDLAKMFIEAMSLYNRDGVFRRIQVLKAAQLNAHILTGMQDFIKANDAQMGWTDGSNWINILVNTALNTFEYWSAFDRASGFNPSAIGIFTGVSSDLWKYKIDTDDDRVKEAQSIMAEITNATRSHTDITARTGVMPLTFGVVNLIGSKMGQTRMIGRGEAIPDPKPEVKQIGDQQHYWKKDGESFDAKKANIGDRLASDDFLSGGTGIASVALENVVMTAGSKVGDGIVTAASQSKHYRYTFDSGKFTGVGNRGNWVVVPFPPEPFKTWSSKSPMEENRHPWTGLPYLSPYITFKADSAMTPNPSSPTRGTDLKTHEYNQPNTWIYLNKRPKQFQTEDNAKPWHQQISYTSPGGMQRGNFQRPAGASSNNELNFQAKGSDTATLDTTINGERTALMGIMQGLNVLSRGQVYYHRPDDWREQPNMFNPFWRARLAPVAQALLNTWERLVGNQLVPGPEAGLIQQLLQNFVNNALSDFLFSTVTQLITH